MSIFTAAELEELRRADAEIDAEFVQTAEEIASAEKRDAEALKANKKLYAKRERQRQYQQKNKDILAAKAKAYQQKNKERIAARKHAHYLAHKEEYAARKRAYREANLDKVRQQERACYEAHREEIAARRKKRKEREKNESGTVLVQERGVGNPAGAIPGAG